MNQSFNSSFDSFVGNLFARTDTQDTISDVQTDNSISFIDEVNEIQQNNIVLLFKLVVKELFKHRSKVAITSECRIFFNHLFVLLERCLQHGLRQRKQIFGSKIEVWNVIELVEKILPEAHDITESAKNLPKIRSSMGRSRAWLRLATMKKKLSDYFQLLLDHRDTLLKDYYDDFALMLSEESNIIAGLLVGLNSFDYDVYIKDEPFDLFEPIIDLKYYLKENIQDFTNGDMDHSTNGDNVDINQLTEQKHYVEEINLHLKSRIQNLESKLKNVLETKAEENDNKDLKSLNEFGTILANKEKQLIEDVRLIKEMDNKLQKEINLRKELQNTNNLLQSEVQEKQDTIVSLRSQLDEIKAINIQIFNKMQEKDHEIADKNATILDNELKLSKFKKEMKHLEKKLSQQSANICDKELVTNYQKLIDEQQEQMTKMQLEIEDLKSKSSLTSHLKEAYNLLKKKYNENELALEEIGKQLQDSKLEIESLKEYNGHLKEAAWAKDQEVAKCRQCERDFTLARRKHHCRSCGEIFCHNCSNNEMPLPSSKKPVRVCDSCHAFLLERYSGSS